MTKRSRQELENGQPCHLCGKPSKFKTCRQCNKPTCPECEDTGYGISSTAGWCNSCRVGNRGG